MSKKYSITIKAESTYEIETENEENEEMALNRAFEYWDMYGADYTDYTIEKVAEDD